MADLEAELDRLALGREQLDTIRAALEQRIAEGLARGGREIKGLPAYLPPPDPALAGRAVVIDTGGTNMRAALLELVPASSSPAVYRSRVVKGPFKQKVPDGRDGRPVSRDAFFGAHVDLIDQLDAEPELPVGYCFSFPSEITPECDARLIAWTKAIQVDGVVGTLVGSGLRDALAATGARPARVRVLNDTVASLLGGAASHGAWDPQAEGAQRGEAARRRSAGFTPAGNRRFDAFVGLIVGTGTNMATFYEPERVPKLDRAGWPGARKIAVNLESGNFSPPHLTRWDDALDASSNNPGTQRFEKAVSGYYLPYLFQAIVPDQPGFDPSLGARTLAEIRDGKTEAGPRAREVAARLLTRSADLVAAGLAAVIGSTHTKGRAGILAEGGLFWGIPGYEERVESTLETLVGGGKAAVLRVEDANLIGAACAALS